ncbi:MAG: Cof-type HAD-IIB family hydrolase [Ruminococcus flavefaciens]|nr:Cof-type HAD-IIB family hydrolase [Ruminococcus flavefaciens]
MIQNELKVIAVDLDGTLLNDQKKISQYSQNVFEQLKMRNKLLAIITARSYPRTMQFLNEIYGHYAICNNGASIWRNDGVCVYVNCIETQVYDKMIRKIYDRFHNIELEIIMNKKTVFAASHQEASCLIEEPVEGILIYKHAKDILTLLSYECLCQKKLLEGNTLLITGQFATKRLGLEYLLKLVNIPAKCAIAFGDDINDIEVLKFCAEGIVPENGVSDAKKLATAVCGSNNADGIAIWLSKKFNIFN